MPFYESPSELTAATDIIVTSATAFRVGRTEAAPAFVVNTNTALSATGIQIVAAAAAGGVAVSIVSSGTNEALTLDAKGSGTVSIAGTSTGNVILCGGGGVLVCGTGPTTITNATGLILSAALNTVAVAQGGTGLTSGTSGGVLAYTAAGTLASSAALVANQLMIGGGAGVVPATLGSLGTTTTVLHGNAAGAPTFGAVVLTADVSGILPTANGGTGIAFFTAAGPTVARVYTFPDAAATVLTTNAAVTVAQGGTGIASGTSGGVPYFSATTTIASSGLLTASAIVLGGGAGASPTSLALGTANQVLGMNSGATAYEHKSFAVGTTGTDFAVAHSANTVTFNLPDASATARGVVTTGTQTFAGAKTFSGAITHSSTLAQDGVVTMGDGINIVLNATTGTKIGTATTQKLGFYNAAPVVQPAALSTQLTSITHTAPGTPDYAVQNLVAATGFGFVTADEGNTVLSVILNLQVRMAEVEARLEALGLVAAN